MKALGALVLRSTCASSLCQDSLSGSSARSEIVVLEPGWLRHVCCSCEVLGGSVRIEAEQMSWLALFVCHICQMAFFGKSLAKKKPKTTLCCQDVQLSVLAPADRDIQKDKALL